MRKIAIATLTLIALFVSPSFAQAHATLVSANPAPNSNLSFMPKKIELTFSESLKQITGKSPNSITISYMKYSDLGVGIILSDIRVNGSTLSASVPADQYRTGKYLVSYTIVSADGHKLSDSYSIKLHSFGNPLTTTSSHTDQVEKSHKLPLAPIVGGVAAIVFIGGFLVFRRFQNAKESNK